MNISLEEAISILEGWRAAGTPLRASFSGRAASRELETVVTSVRSPFVNLAAGSEQIELDLSGADFNGDPRVPGSLSHGAYLVCEFPNSDRWSFYAPRSPRQT